MKILKKIDVILLLIISGFSITILVLDYFDILNKIEFFKNLDYSILAVLILSTIGLHLGLSFITFQESENNKSKLLESLINDSNNIKVQLFENSFDLETYLAKRVYEAKSEVCDLSWKNTISPAYGIGKRKTSHQIFEKALADHSKSLVYKEIWMFNDERRVDKLNKRLRENKEGYSCRYFKEDSNIPRLQFVIIDNEEVLFFATNSNSLQCAIKGDNISKVFKPYFDEIWNKATPIKDGNKKYANEIQFINDNYSA